MSLPSGAEDSIAKGVLRGKFWPWGFQIHFIIDSAHFAIVYYIFEVSASNATDTFP
jgi:hypothetical protein